MIIEAGYDLHAFLEPNVRAEHVEGPRHRVWALGTDRDLRLVTLEAVADWRGNDLGLYGDSLARTLDDAYGDIAHYALAWWSPAVQSDGPERYDAAKALVEHPALVTRRLLGVAVYDDEGFRETFPRFDFN